MGGILGGIAGLFGYKILKKPVKRKIAQARSKFSDFRPRRSKEYKISKDDREEQITAGVDKVDVGKYSPYLWQDFDKKMQKRKDRNFARLEQANKLHAADLKKAEQRVQQREKAVRNVYDKYGPDTAGAAPIEDFRKWKVDKSLRKAKTKLKKLKK